MTASNTTGEQAERFARETGNGAHSQQPEPLTAAEILELMLRAAPGANRLLRRMNNDHLRGLERAGKLILR